MSAPTFLFFYVFCIEITNEKPKVMSFFFFFFVTILLRHKENPTKFAKLNTIMMMTSDILFFRTTTIIRKNNKKKADTVDLRWIITPSARIWRIYVCEQAGKQAGIGLMVIEWQHEGRIMTRFDKTNWFKTHYNRTILISSCKTKVITDRQTLETHRITYGKNGIFMS